MRDGPFENRHLNEIFLGSLCAFGYSGSDFTGLTQTVADNTVLISYNNDGCKCECTAALRYFGHAVNGHKALLELQILYCFYSIHISLRFLEFETCLTRSVR